MKDRFIARLVDFLVRMLYRDVKVYWVVPPPESGPELTVANHFGGVADALLLFHVLPRRPGVIARDVIWKPPVVGRLMNWIGAIPVHKPDDSGAPSSNAQMFGSCFAALDDGRPLLIFPEGVTRNEPSIARVRTGAARIVLGARDSGVDDIVVTPVGIHYEDKAALRSRVVVIGGAPIRLDEFAATVPRHPAEEGPDHDGVVALTAEIDAAIRRAAPDFADWDEARDLTDAAEIALRAELDDPSGPVPVGLSTRLANALADRSPARREEIVGALGRYREHLDRLGLHDADVVGGGRRISVALALRTVLAVLLAPFALAGAVINLLPFLAVKGVGRMKMAPSMHSTVKPIVAIGAYGLVWAVVIWRAATGWGVAGAAAAVFLLPIYLTVAILYVDRAASWWRSRRDRRSASGRGPERSDAPAELTDERRAVVEAVWGP